MKRDIYITPKYQEMRKLGYVPDYITKECQESIYKAFTIMQAPLAKEVYWYKQYYGNIYELSRRVVSCYVYAIKHTSEYGGKLDNSSFDILARSRREILSRYNLFSSHKTKRATFKDSYLETFGDILFNEIYEECKKHAIAMDEPKKEAKPKKKHVYQMSEKNLRYYESLD